MHPLDGELSGFVWAKKNNAAFPGANVARELSYTTLLRDSYRF